MREQIQEAVRMFHEKGYNVRYADVHALEHAVLEQITAGEQGSVVEILEMLNQTIGLEEFGIVYADFQPFEYPLD